MSPTDRIDVRTGGVAAAAGAASYLLGYLLVYVTRRGWIGERLEGFNLLAELIGGDPIPAWKGAGWLFFNAHFVATEFPNPLGGVRVENFLASAEGGLVTLLYALPPLLLLAAGAVAAQAAAAEGASDGAATGALVAAGYLPLAVLGLFAFRFGVGDGAITPDPISAVLLAGIVYPAAFGAVGGGIVGSVADDSE